MANKKIVDLPIASSIVGGEAWLITQGLLSKQVSTSTIMSYISNTLTKSDVELSNVDNTSDVNKPVSTAAQTALDLKVDKISGKGLSTNDFTNYYKTESETATFIADETGSSVHVSGGVITPTGGIGFNVASGVGYTRNPSGKLIRVVWSSTNSSTINNGDNFINIDYNGSVVITSSASTGDLIGLGYISTALANTVIIGYSNAHLTGKDHLFNLGEFLRSSVGSLVQSGCSTAMQATPDDLKIYLTGGFVWTLLHRFTVTDKTTFTKLMNSSDFGFVVESSTTANTVMTGYYNVTSNPAASALVAMTSGYYKKDLIVITPEGTCFYIYGTSQYATLDEALAAPTPAVPENIKLSVIRSAALVCQEGATTVNTVLDVRPMLSRLFDTGQAASNATVISHSDLTNLSSDDHLQYHNDSRGDVRYYRKSELTSGVLDSRYYTESEVDALLTGYSLTSHSHSNATTSVAGYMSTSDKTKLDGVATGATTNQTDAYLLARANHTGTQDVATITGLDKSSVGLSNVVNLDQTNADNITGGTLDDARLSANLYDFASISFSTNEISYFNGTNIVGISPNSYKSLLSLTKSDVGLGNVVNVDTTTTTNIAEGSNLYFTTLRAANAAPVQSVNGLTGTLSLTKTQVGLSNVANVDTTNATNISSGTLANARLTANLTEIGGITKTNDDIIQVKAGVYTNRTMAQLKTDLVLVKADVGLGNVDNTSDANKPVSTATQTALDLKVDTVTNLGSGSAIFTSITGTTAQLRSVTSGASGTVIIAQNTNDISYDVPYARGPSNARVGFFEDFITTTVLPFSSYMTRVITNTGAITVNNTPTFGGTDQRVGILQLSTGAVSATGGAQLYGGATGSLFNLGNLAVNQSVEIAASVRIPTLSTGTQRFTFYFGIGDMTTTAESVDGVYFKYNDANSSGAWEFVKASNSVRTATTTGTTVVAATDYNLRVKCTNVAGTITAFWYINGSQVGTTTSGLPITTGRDTSIKIAIVKSIGTTALTAQCDWIWFDYMTTRSVVV